MAPPATAASQRGVVKQGVAMGEPYPADGTQAARDAWILARRGPRARPEPDPGRVQAALVEDERSAAGEVVPVATLFLTNRECPWRCLMCDLWRHTLEESVAPGMIPAQIDAALAQLAAAGGPVPRQIKLYNSGSFFDPRAIPPEDLPAIARRVAGFERVIVECHPSLVNGRVADFRDQLGPGVTLEVAMGLETVHPEILPRLNKRMTTELFARAAEVLRSEGVALRAFVLVQLPFLPESEAAEWAVRSAAFAFECGATVVALIPTRLGNGAMDALAAAGEFTRPRLETFEAAIDGALAVAAGRGRVLADLWDLETFSRCAACFPARRARLDRINRGQRAEPRVACPACGAVDSAGAMEAAETGGASA